MTQKAIKKAVVNLIANRIDEESDYQIQFIEMYGPYIHVCTSDGTESSFRIALRPVDNDSYDTGAKYKPHGRS